MWLYEKSVAERIVSAPIDRVWELLANRSNVSWRTDIMHVETELSQNKITEFYPNGQKLEFFIIDEQPNKYRIYKIKHRFFSGYIWEEYKTAKNNQTRIIITEKIRLHNDVLGVISRLAFNLKNGQIKYLHDIEMVLTH